jgi:hypothetical protein
LSRNIETQRTRVRRGIWPGFFSANAFGNLYWSQPKLYNRDRPVFRHYVPLLRRINYAGWRATPYARMRGGGGGLAAAVSPFLAWIGSPCLRHCLHGASIGGGDGGALGRAAAERWRWRRWRRWAAGRCQRRHGRAAVDAAP